MVQINGTPRKGPASEKVEAKMVRAYQRWLNNLQFLKRLTSDKDTLLQPVRPTQIDLAHYGLGDAYKGVGQKWILHAQDNNRDMRNLVEVVEE